MKKYKSIDYKGIEYKGIDYSSIQQKNELQKYQVQKHPLQICSTEQKTVFTLNRFINISTKHFLFVTHNSLKLSQKRKLGDQ